MSLKLSGVTQRSYWLVHSATSQLLQLTPNFLRPFFLLWRYTVRVHHKLEKNEMKWATNGILCFSKLIGYFNHLHYPSKVSNAHLQLCSWAPLSECECLFFFLISIALASLDVSSTEPCDMRCDVSGICIEHNIWGSSMSDKHLSFIPPTVE